MKKLLTALLAVLLILSVAGCSSNTAEPAKEDTAQQETEKEETKEETPAPAEKEESTQKETLSLGAVFDYTIPEDWTEVEPFVFEAAGGEVYAYLYLLPKRPEGLDVIPAGMKVSDADFPEAWRKYVEAAYSMKAEYGALPGYAEKSGGGVDYFNTIMTLSDSQGSTNELMNVYDYNEDIFFLIEYAYGAMMAGKANDCAKAFNETLSYVK